jgi:alkylation response protein AidB-like acyl-CoA dehydrogenase
MNEEVFAGASGSNEDFKSVFELAKRLTIDDRPAIENAIVRSKLADWYCQEAGLRYTSYRTLSALSRGDTPGPQNSMGKLVDAPKTQDMASFAMDLLEQSGVICDEEYAAEAGLYQGTYMSIPDFRIAGGTDEIMANIIAERVLELPQDVRVDKGIPFSEVPTGS